MTKNNGSRKISPHCAVSQLLYSLYMEALHAFRLDKAVLPYEAGYGPGLLQLLFDIVYMFYSLVSLT